MGLRDCGVLELKLKEGKMNVSKIMATTAVCMLMAGGALAQAPLMGGTVEDQTVGGDAGAAYSPVDRETAERSVTYAVMEVQGGGTVPAVSEDGQSIGLVNMANVNEAGQAMLSIALDQGLGANAPIANFVGTPSLDDQGRLVIPMTAADFVAAVNR